MLSWALHRLRRQSETGLEDEFRCLRKHHAALAAHLVLVRLMTVLAHYKKLTDFEKDERWKIWYMATTVYVWRSTYF